jgi:hypothetical protein
LILDEISEKKALMAKLFQSTFRLTSTCHQKVVGYLVKNFVISLPLWIEGQVENPRKKLPWKFCVLNDAITAF